jgi:hypothetical protein
MSDFDIQRATSRRELIRFWISVAAAGLIGLTLEAFVGWKPIPFVVSALGNLLSLVPEMAPAITASPWLGAASGCLAGMLLAATVLSTRTGKALLNILLPASPVFVRADLAQERARSMTLLEREAPAFVGRVIELRELADFSRRSERFRWMSIAGASGIGKSRLAIQWLADQASEGADVGIVAAMPPIGWCARLPTALVIDDASRAFGTGLDEVICRLAAGARRGRPVRLLVVDHVPRHSISRSKKLPSPGANELAAAGVLDLAPLPVEEAALLWRALAGRADNERALKAANGSPRGLILMARGSATTVGEALQDWVSDLLPELDDDSPNAAARADLGFLRVLCLAALAGPLPARFARKLWQDFNPHALRRFWPFADPAADLPPIEPQDLAHEILLRGLAFLGEQASRQVFQVALDRNPRGLEQTLRALWRSRPEGRSAMWTEHAIEQHDPAGLRAAALWRLQQWFDAARPEVAKRALENVQACVAEALEPQSVDVVRQCFERAAAEFDGRPFDMALAADMAGCAANVLHTLGTGFFFAEVERWARWWHDHIERCVDAAPFLEVERIGEIHCIMEHYGQAGRFSDVERWAVMSGVGPGIDPSQTPMVAAEQAALIATAIGAYEWSGDRESLARWADAVVHFAQSRPGEQLPHYNKAIASCMSALSRAHAASSDWEGADAWRAQLKEFSGRIEEGADLIIIREILGNSATLIAASRQPHLRNRLESLIDDVLATTRTHGVTDDKDCLLWATRALGNAVVHLTKQQDLPRAEALMSQLLKLTAATMIQLDAELKEVELRAAGELASGYYDCGATQDMERWLNFIGVAVDGPEFEDAEGVLASELEALANLFSLLGRGGDVATVEALRPRVIGSSRLRRSVSPRIAAAQARAAVNAVVAYDVARRYASPERANWRDLLARRAREFPDDLDLQGAASLLRVTYAEQQHEGWPLGAPPPIKARSVPLDPVIAAARNPQPAHSKRGVSLITRNPVQS